MKFDTGDIGFVLDKQSLISKIIRTVTFGRASHVFLVRDADTVCETDWGFGKAKLHPIKKFKGKRVEYYRFTGLAKEQKDEIMRLCDKYKGTPYSYVDVLVKGLFFWLHPQIRRGISRVVGTKKYMICNELVMRILWEVLHFPPFQDFEAHNPSEMLLLVRQWPSRVQCIQKCERG